MEEGVTIAKVPDWMQLKPEMMRHLITCKPRLLRRGTFKAGWSVGCSVGW